MADKKQNALKYGEVVAKCWEDEAYKKRFLEDPVAVLSEAGFVVEEGVTYKVIEQPKLMEYIVLPHDDVKSAVQEISKRLLNKAEKEKTLIPEGMELRIIQNTDDTRYLILPASPKSLTKAELAAVAGGNTPHVGVDIEAVQTAVAVTTEVEVSEVVTTTIADAEVAVAVVVVLI